MHNFLDVFDGQEYALGLSILRTLRGGGGSAGQEGSRGYPRAINRGCYTDVVVLAFLQESPLRAAEATLGRPIIETRQSTAVALVTNRREGCTAKQ